MELQFTEKIGDFEILKNGEIIVFKNASIELKLIEHGIDSVLLIKFSKIEDTKPMIRQYVENNIMIFDFINIDKNQSVTGIYEPTEIAVSDDGMHTIYLNCALMTLKNEDGNRLFKYSILAKNNNGCTEIRQG